MSTAIQFRAQLARWWQSFVGILPGMRRSPGAIPAPAPVEPLASPPPPVEPPPVAAVEPVVEHPVEVVEPPKPKRTGVRKQRIAQLRAIAEQRHRVADMIDRLLTNFTFDPGMYVQPGLRRTAEHLAVQVRECDYFLIAQDANIDDNIDQLFVNPRHRDDMRDLVDMFWPVDTGIISQQEDGWFTIMRATSVEPADVRGKIRLVPVNKRILACTHGDLHKDGSWWLEQIFCGFVGNRWINIGQTDQHCVRYDSAGPLMRKARQGKDKADEVAVSVGLAFSNLLTQRYDWHVALGTVANGPHILLPSSPEGCRAFFADRDVAANRSRRAALRHWVARHLRDNGEAGVAFVRQHLRGATDFKWRDLQCEILVSEYDLARNEDFKHDAERWRATRRHNQFGVRLKMKR